MVVACFLVVVDCQLVVAVVVVDCPAAAVVVVVVVVVVMSYCFMLPYTKCAHISSFCAAF